MRRTWRRSIAFSETEVYEVPGSAQTWLAKKPGPITLQSRRSLGVLLDELDGSAASLVQACRAQNWADVENLVLIIKSYVRSIKEEVPGDLAKAQITQLDQHAQFVAVYVRKRDLKFVLSNAHAIRPDVQRLRSALGIGGKDELREAVEMLPPGRERELLDEAVRCLEADSPRAAVVMAVCSLENLLRRFYESKTKQDSKKMEFWRIIDEVAKMQGLSDSEKVLLDLCRPFRNFAAHPSEYTHTKRGGAGNHPLGLGTGQEEAGWRLDLVILR